MQEEYAKGNYVIAGGDFNQTFPGVDTDKFPIINTENIKIDNKDFTKYTYENLEQYNDARNGARGYIFTGKIDYSDLVFKVGEVYERRIIINIRKKQSY